MKQLSCKLSNAATLRIIGPYFATTSALLAELSPHGGERWVKLFTAANFSELARLHRFKWFHRLLAS